MADLQRLAALVQAERQGVLLPDNQAVLTELRDRAQRKNQTLAAYIEPILAIGTGAIAQPVSGLVGLAGLPFGVDAAANAVRRTQDALTFQPKTKQGQENIARLGGAVQRVADSVNPIAAGTVASLYDAIPFTSDNAQDIYDRLPKQGLSGDLAALVEEKTGSPLAATLAHLYPAAALELFALKGAGKIPGNQYEFGGIGGQSFGQRGAVGSTRLAASDDLDVNLKEAEVGGYDTNNVYVHQSREDAPIQQIGREGNFSGIFSLEDSVSSGAAHYGDNTYRFVIKGDPWEDVDLMDAINENLDTFQNAIDNDTFFNTYSKEFSVDDAEVLEKIKDAVSDSEIVFDEDVAKALAAIDYADYYKEVQILRGKVAGDLGAPAVRMSDEFGDDTVLLLPGDKVMQVQGVRGGK